jgi:hypothetical protein
MADAFQPRFVDLVRNFTTTQGTGDFVLGPAVNGFASFTDALEPGDGFYYSAIGVDKPAEREVGRGVLSATGKISRSPIGGAATNFSSGTKSIALIAAAEWFTKLEAGGAGGSNALRSRAGVASAPSSQPAVWLTEPGREGLFVFDASNCAAKVAADIAQGVFIAPASDPSGASGAWVRKFDGEVHVDWFGAVGDGVTDDTAAFVALRSVVGALSTSGTLGLRRGPDIRLGAKEYFLASDFDCKGFTATWRGSGGGFAAWNNTGATTIRMASGKTWYFQRSNTEGGSTGTTIPFGCDGSVFYDITWRGPGKGTGTASVARMRAKISLYNCRFIEGGGHGLEINATAGGGTTTEGNANCWLMIGGACSLNGKSGMYTVGADTNAGVCVGTTFDNNAEYGIFEDSFLGNQYYGIHCDANTLGHVHGTGVNNASEFHGYYESGYPPSVIPPRSWASGVNSYDQIDGGAIGATDAVGTGKSILTATGFLIAKTQAGKTLNVKMNTRPGTFPGMEWDYTDFCSGTKALTQRFRTGVDAYVWEFGTGSTYYMLSVNGDGSGGLPRYTHGLSVPPAAALGLSSFYLGDGTGVPDGRRFVTATAVPASGEHAQGEFAFNRGISAASPMFAWACTASGTPGTHTALYALTAAPAAIATSGSGADLAAASVSYAKIQNVSAASKLLGRASAGAGAIEELGLAGGLTLSGSNLSLGAITPTSVAAAGAVTSTAGGMGYATGAGGAVTQATSKSTGVTLNKPSGQVTTHNASLAAAAVVSFVVTNSAVATTDTINLNLASGNATAGAYRYWVEGIAAGSFKIVIENRSGGALAEALVFNFAVLKAVNA